MNVVNVAVSIISLCAITMLSYMVWDVNQALTDKVNAVRPMYNHTSSLYESVEDECGDYNVTHCSAEMLDVLRAQR